VGRPPDPLTQATDPSTPGDAGLTRAERYRLTTVGATSEPVLLAGRIVALLIMLGGLVLLGYVAGVLAALLFGKRPDCP
jgi:hypothetical protein